MSGMLIFACFSPHPPLLLPSVGSKEARGKVKKTLEALDILGKKFKKLEPDSIIISSPHPDWGFNVPLHFLAQGFKGKIEQFLIGVESPQFSFEEGKKVYKSNIKYEQVPRPDPVEDSRWNRSKRKQNAK